MTPFRSLGLRARPHAPLAASLLMLMTGCRFFSSVVIPASDTTKPLSIASVYDFDTNGYPALSTVDKVRYVVTDPNKLYLAVGATFDAGGAKRLQIQGVWAHYCTASEYPGYLASASEYKTEQGPAAVTGDSVLNGLWSYFPVRFADGPPSVCPGGRKPHHISFVWFTGSADYHSNFSENMGEIVYYPR